MAVKLQMSEMLCSKLACNRSMSKSTCADCLNEWEADFVAILFSLDGLFVC